MKDDTLILKATGIDAGTFLQDQLTCDMNVLAEGRWTYAACCDPHGKTLAILWVFPWPDGILLRLPRSAAPAFLAQTRENIDGREVHIEETTLHFGVLAGDNPSTEQRLIAADDKTLIGDIFARLGAKNIADGLKGSTPSVSAEYILEQNPDIIVIVGGETEDFLKANPILRNTKAVKSGKILKAPTLILRGSPQIGETVDEIYAEATK